MTGHLSQVNIHLEQFDVELFCGITPVCARPTTEALHGIHRGPGKRRGARRPAYTVEELLHRVVVGGRTQKCRADGGPIGAQQCTPHAPVTSSLCSRCSLERRGAVLAQVRQQMLPTMKKHGPVVAWIVDDTALPKQGKYSVGVARQYCGQVGKQANCQAAVSLSVSTWSASLPIAWRLYLPEVWCEDAERCQQAGVPEGVAFQTKPEIALEQIRQAMEAEVPKGVVLADAGYGKGTQFRTALSQLGLPYVMGIESNTTVWEPGQQPLPAPARKPGRGAPPKRLQRNADHRPMSVKELAFGLSSSLWKDIAWRQGSQRKLRSRCAAVRVRPAHRDYKQTEPHPEEWLLIEWPKKESEPTKYWLSTMPAKTSLQSLVKMAKHRWIVERDYEELKQELGLGHYEGRGWRGFHHHATLCIAAYGQNTTEMLLSEEYCC